MKSISVDDLFSSGKISRKTYNTLVRARMRTVFDLKRYESGLPRLFRAGASGMREIKSLLSELDASDNMPEMTSMLFGFEEPEASSGETMLATLSEEDVALLDVVYKRQIDDMLNSHERLATRIAHALSTLPVTTFIRDFLYEDDDRILMLNDVSENSMPYVNAVKNVVKDVVESLKDSDVPVAFRILCLQADGLLDDDSFLLEYFKENQRLPVLYVMQKALLAAKDTPVVKTFLQRYDIFGGKVEIDTEKINKSSFTITTYSNSVFDALFTPGAPADLLGSFVAQLIGNDVNVGYLAEKLAMGYVTESTEAIGDIVSSERLLMEPLCVVAILGKLLAHVKTCYGGYARSFGVAMDERWAHAYLVDQIIAKAFDFKKELWQFRDHIVRTCTEQFSIDFKEYTAKLLENQSEMLPFLDDISGCLQCMAVDELGLTIDEEGCVVVPRMRDKPLADRLYKILDKEKQPMSLDELTERINSGDGRRYVRASVSLALNKDERFQGSGKKGCYALSVWQLPFFGSNAEIVYQVLSESGRPMKGEEIVEIISAHQYNKQFSKNDLSSVISLGKDMFLKLGGGYYGLVGMEYPADFVIPQKRSFESEMEAFLAFIEQHRRPLTLHGDDEEVRLRAWFMRKKNEWEGNNSWSDQKREDFAKLVARYEEIIRAGQPLEIPMTPQPLAPENLESPENPENPASPASPETPENPESPVSLETPVSPAIPDSPASPAPSVSPASHPLIPDNAGTTLAPPSSPEEDAFEVFAESDSGEHPMVFETPSLADWDDMLQKVRDFITQNRREPLAMFTVEVQLANWLASQKRAMHEEALSPEQKAALLDLRDMLW